MSDQENQEKRLEQALRAWEDQMLLNYIQVSCARLVSNLPSAQSVLETYQDLLILSPEEVRTVRGRLLQATSSSERGFSIQNMDSSSQDPFVREGTVQNLLGWCKNSRRMYKVPLDLQLLLQTTSLRGVPWVNIELPFEAFTVLLAEPLTVDDEAYDAVILNRSGESLSVSILPQSLQSYVPIDRFDRERMLHALRTGDVPKTSRRLLPFLEEGKHPPNIYTFNVGTADVYELPPDAPIVDVSNKKNVLDALETNLAATGVPHLGRTISMAIRIGLGLALYFSTLPSSERKERWRKAPPGRSALRVVTDEAQVCEVQNVHVLTAEEREVFRDHGRRRSHELNPHFRSGYWSRPPGQGADPTASKTIWHRPSLVRKDRLPEGALPVGSKKIIRE